MNTFLNKPHLLKLLLISVVVLTIGAVVGIFIKYRNTPPHVQKVGRTATMGGKARLALGKIEHTATRNGKKEWTLTAESASMMDGKRKKMLIQKPSVVFFLEDGEKVYLTADRGVLDTVSNNMEAIGDVKVTHKAYVLKTQRLVYLHKKRKILSRNPVKIEGKKFVLRSKSMVYDLDKKTSIFEGRVKGVLYENIIL